MEPILFLAPFASMVATARAVAAKMGVSMHIDVAENSQAKEVIDRYRDIDVIISRGGLAEEAKNVVTGMSIVEITMSINDLMESIHRLTHQGCRRIGVVSRANIFDDEVADYQFSDIMVFMRPCENDEAIQPTIDLLHKQGIEAIIGCKLVGETAAKYGLMTEFLNSGEVSVRKAINEARKIMRAKEYERLRSAQLNAIIDNIEEGVVAVSEDNTVRFYNKPAGLICGADSGGVQYDNIKELLKGRDQEQIVTLNSHKVLPRIIPLYANNVYKGNVITFQEVSSIQASERKIRLSSYQKGLYAKKTFADIVAQSDAMRQLVEKAKTFSQYDSNILLYGETGTGKEILAQSIHNHSRRRSGPFVSVNCASIPPSLMESELFGYVEGAFTGARKGGKQGLFELSHGGTIFLDEIGELPFDIQSRLLRVLQEREIMRIGDDKIIPVDIRVICATNRDLLHLVKEGRFRQDLYYRINVLKLRLPPLRERAEDIPLLFQYYLNRYRQKQRRQIKVSGKAIKMLSEYAWEGNIRELKNMAEVLALREETLIDAPHIMELLREENGEDRSGPYLYIRESNTLKEMETAIIAQLLSRYPTEEVCRRLGISRVTLWRKANRCFNNETKRIQL